MSRHWFWISLFFFASSSGAASTAEEQILQATDQFLEQQIQEYSRKTGSNQYTIQLKPPPGMSRLTSCNSAPVVTLINSSRAPVGPISTRVSCKEGATWNLLVKAEVAVFLPVVVSAILLDRDHLIEVDQLLLKEMDIARLKQGYFTDIDDVAGQRAKRTINLDKVITKRLLKVDDLIKKGDKITIIAGAAGFQISMPGIALQKGQRYDQISVRNLKSGKIIVARVVDRGKVKTQY